MLNLRARQRRLNIATCRPCAHQSLRFAMVAQRKLVVPIFAAGMACAMLAAIIPGSDSSHPGSSASAPNGANTQQHPQAPFATWCAVPPPAQRARAFQYQPRALPARCAGARRALSDVSLLARVVCGRLADPNTCMTSQHFALFVMVGMNKNNYKPPLKDIKELYYRKFRGNSSED